MVQLLQLPSVIRTRGDMCQRGMAARDSGGEGLVLKPTGWATNSPYIAAEVAARCSNRCATRASLVRRHVTLVGGRAKAAENLMVL